MTWKTTTYNRNVLYEQVWKEPILTVAKSYGISNVGLAKICRRLRVPLPWRGYWEKVRNGERIKRPALADLRPGEPEEYVSEKWAKPVVELEQKGEFDQAASREHQADQEIVVPPELVDPHRLVVQTEKSLRGGKRNEQGLQIIRAEKRLSVKVAGASIDRAMRIMDSLLKGLESRGYGVSVGVGETKGTTAKVLGETLHFWLEEQVDRTERPLTAEQKTEKKQFPWRHSAQYDYRPNGRLTLRIGDSTRYGGRRCSDGSKQKLENCLNKFIEGLVRAAESQLAERLEDERRQRERQEEERRRWENYQKQEKERQRVEKLKQDLESWSLSRRIREYVTDLRENAVEPNRWTIWEVPLPEWMEWALKYADEIDPVSPIRKDRELKTALPPASNADRVVPLLPEGGIIGEVPEGGN